MDSDVSYFRNGFGARIDIKPVDKFHIKPFYEFHYKEYTTNHAVAIDSLHAGRHDVLNETGVAAEYNFTENLSVFLRWAFQNNSADTDSAASSSGRDDVLGYRAYEGSSGVTYKI